MTTSHLLCLLWRDLLDNVVVFAQFLEERDLTDRRRGDAFVLGLETDLLERNKVARLEVHRLVDDTIGA